VVIDVHLQSLKHIDYAISVKDIKDFEQRYRPLRAGDIVLFRTDWSQFWNDKKKYLGTNRFKDVTHLHFPGISKEAAHYLVDAKIKGVGIDTASLDPGNSKTFWAHRIILGANLYGLENLNQVHKLTPLKTYIIAAPMKIKGGSGGPTRVFALNRDLE
jgi:kynurenine formamidase